MEYISGVAMPSPLTSPLSSPLSSPGAHGSVGAISDLSNFSGGSSHSGTSADGDHDMELNNNGQVREHRDRAEAWWSVGEHLESKNLTHQSAKFTLTGNRVFGNQRDELWDLSDSLVELYETIQRSEGGGGPQQLKRIRNTENKNRMVDINDWLSKDISHGFVRVYAPDMVNFLNSRLVPVTLSTTVQQVAHSIGLSMNAIHVQFNGDVIRRMDAYEHPLVLQNQYLAGLGFDDINRIQEEGPKEDLGYLVRFYSGKPMFDSTFSRNQLQAYLEIRKGGVLQNWIRRLCVLSGTRLLIYKDKYKRTEPTVVQLARGAVEEAKFKGHEFCLRLTSTLNGERIMFLSFTAASEFQRWFKKCKKATDKLPTSADLSNCHLEFLPENIFVNDQLAMLNLRHNVLKERPIEEDIFVIGWLDDLSRFTRLRSLNLADNKLVTFPIAVCHIPTLVELNIASNKLEEIPPDIAELYNLQALHIHNNHLTSLPDDLVQLRKLFILVLAFNRFQTVPPVVAQMTNIRVSEIENIIMAGNRIERIPSETLMEMKYVKKVDLRMNQLSLTNNETMKFTVLEHLTHLDIRDNKVHELDVRPLRTLEYLNCQRNDMVTLRVNGTQLKSLFAAQNCLETLHVNPKPEYLQEMNVSYNQLRELPDWMSDCFFLQKINVGYNLLSELPARFFIDAKRLKTLRADHNHLRQLPAEVDVMTIEEVYLHHNLITQLPDEFFINANKLRVFNASKNRLTVLPPVNKNLDLNKLQELYLTANHLGDSAVRVIAGFPRLKILHIAHNEIYNLPDRDIKQLDMLQEINISGNQLRNLPASVGTLTKLVVLRAHTNVLSSLPDFHKAVNLRVLDVGHNQLYNVSVTSLMASQLNLLDMSLNTQLKVDPREYKSVKNRKSICLVDATGQNRDLPGLKRQSRSYEQEEETDPNSPWKVGCSETSGIRNKLCVGTVKLPKFRNDNESLFAMFDGGHNDEVPKLLKDKLPDLMKEEISHPKTEAKYIKYVMLNAHRTLKAAGQKLGACGAIIHLQRVSAEQMNIFRLQLANIGDVEVVLCRHGEAKVLTRKFVTQEDLTECDRIQESDGIVTEDNKVNGVTKNTRLLGCAFLYPHIIPCPFTAEVSLRNDDEFLIIANRGLWKYISYGHAVEEIYDIGNPVVAAKRLMDIAQGYGSKENVSILVVRLNTDRGPSLGRLKPPARDMSIDDVQAAAKHEIALRAEKLAQGIARREAANRKAGGSHRHNRERERDSFDLGNMRIPSQSDRAITTFTDNTGSTDTLVEEKNSPRSRQSVASKPNEYVPNPPTGTNGYDSDLTPKVNTKHPHYHKSSTEPKVLLRDSLKSPKMIDSVSRPGPDAPIHNTPSSNSDKSISVESSNSKQTVPKSSVERKLCMEGDSSVSVAQRPVSIQSLQSDVSDLSEPREGSPSTSPMASQSAVNKDLKPLPNQRFVKKNAAQEWELLLQKRLSSEVKDKELKQVTGLGSEDSVNEPLLCDVPRMDSDMVVMDTIGKSQGHKIADAMDIVDAISPAPRKSRPSQPWYAAQTAANPAYELNPGTTHQNIMDMTSSNQVADTTPNSSVRKRRPENVRSRIAMFENIQQDSTTPKPNERRRTFFSPARPEPQRTVNVPQRRCMSPPPNMVLGSEQTSPTSRQQPIIKPTPQPASVMRPQSVVPGQTAQNTPKVAAINGRPAGSSVRSPSAQPTAKPETKQVPVSRPHSVGPGTFRRQLPTQPQRLDKPSKPVASAPVPTNLDAPRQLPKPPTVSPTAKKPPTGTLNSVKSPVLGVGGKQPVTASGQRAPNTTEATRSVQKVQKSQAFHGSVESDLYSKVKRVKKTAPPPPGTANGQVLAEESDNTHIVEISHL